MLVWCYLQTGQNVQALEAANGRAELSGRSAASLAALAQAEVACGNIGMVRRALRDEIEEAAKQRYVPGYDRATAFLASGQTQERSPLPGASGGGPRLVVSGWRSIRVGIGCEASRDSRDWWPKASPRQYPAARSPMQDGQRSLRSWGYLLRTLWTADHGRARPLFRFEVHLS